LKEDIMKKLFTLLFLFFLSGISIFANYSNNESVYKNSKFVLYENPKLLDNSFAKIKFYLAEPGKVDLSVYNLIGQKLFQVADKDFLSGTHEVEFNTASLSSGLYMYKMEFNDKIVDVRKMTILK